MRALARFVRLPAGRRAVLVEALARVLAARTALTVLPWSVLLARSERAASRASAPADAAPDAAAEVGWAVGAASRRVPGARCLTQALAARAMLARRGLASELRFGGRRDASGKFEAHAWLESRAQVVYGDARSAEFTPIVGGLESRAAPPQGRWS